jgi:hypothetical protein
MQGVHEVMILLRVVDERAKVLGVAEEDGELHVRVVHEADEKLRSGAWRSSRQ